MTPSNGATPWPPNWLPPATRSCRPTTAASNWRPPPNGFACSSSSCSGAIAIPRGPDVELGPLLEPAPPIEHHPVRRDSRYGFAEPLEIRIDNQAGVLVDLSVTGAQLLLSNAVEDGHEGTVHLPSGETPVSGRARVVWTRLELPAAGKAIRHRVGILFTEVEETAVEAFIIRHSAGRRPS